MNYKDKEKFLNDTSYFLSAKRSSLLEGKTTQNGVLWLIVRTVHFLDFIQNIILAANQLL